MNWSTPKRANVDIFTLFLKGKIQFFTCTYSDSWILTAIFESHIVEIHVPIAFLYLIK